MAILKPLIYKYIYIYMTNPMSNAQINIMTVLVQASALCLVVALRDHIESGKKQNQTVGMFQRCLNSVCVCVFVLNQVKLG